MPLEAFIVRYQFWNGRKIEAIGVKSNFVVQTSLLLALGACSATFDGAASGTTGAIPDEVAQIAAPYQDLTTARLRPEDGCYWYLHTGPVETTLIPLRDAEGRIICSANRSGPIG